jgi:hypothetical protein
VYALFRLGGNLPGAPEPPPAPGVLKGMQIPPLLSAANCLSPMVAIASVGLILVGLRQMVDPQ